MEKIEVIYYKHKNKNDLDVSDANLIRFCMSNNEHIDIRFKDSKLYIMGSSSIEITLPGGSNCININIKK